ncbi:MAG TPA: hypothetical protein VF142_13510 [Longimicrobium sp.]
MADIDIERKRKSPLPWILGLLALALLAFLLMRALDGGDPEPAATVTDTTTAITADTTTATAVGAPMTDTTAAAAPAGPTPAAAPATDTTAAGTAGADTTPG